MRRSKGFFFTTLSAAVIVWGSNLYNAVTKSPGPDSRVKMNVTTQGGNIIIDF